jgi:hypothetical protein
MLVAAGVPGTATGRPVAGGPGDRARPVCQGDPPRRTADRAAPDEHVMARPHIQVVLASVAVPESLRAVLQQAGATASFWPLAEAVHGNPIANADAVVLVVPADTASLTGQLRALFDRIVEHPRPTLVMSTDVQTPALECPPRVPVVFAAGADERDLAIRLTTLLDMRSSFDALPRGLSANRRHREGVIQRYMGQLRLASQVQREFLPEALPRFGPVYFQVVYRPIDYVSGDIYDVRRLDEDHVGIALADASGHGIPAALLTVYIKRALRGKEIKNGSYRILTPAEVLAALNDDILDAQLSECPFVAAVYAVLNIRTLELSLARGGAPYPLYRDRAGQVRLIQSPGGVVGVDADARFEVATLQMQPGDSILFYSDGLERVVAPAGSPRRTAEPVGARVRSAVRVIGGDAEDAGGVAVATLADQSDGPLTQSGWCATLAAAGPVAALEQLSCRQRALRRIGYPLDDLTVLAVQVAL